MSAVREDCCESAVLNGRRVKFRRESSSFVASSAVLARPARALRGLQRARRRARRLPTRRRASSSAAAARRYAAALCCRGTAGGASVAAVCAVSQNAQTRQSRALGTLTGRVQPTKAGEGCEVSEGRCAGRRTLGDGGPTAAGAGSTASWTHG